LLFLQGCCSLSKGTVRGELVPVDECTSLGHPTEGFQLVYAVDDKRVSNATFVGQFDWLATCLGPSERASLEELLVENKDVFSFRTKRFGQDWHSPA
jgi:hypothetical protein